MFLGITDPAPDLGFLDEIDFDSHGPANGISQFFQRFS